MFLLLNMFVPNSCSLIIVIFTSMYLRQGWEKEEAESVWGLVEGMAVRNRSSQVEISDL